MRCKDLESLRVHISHHESTLRQDPSEDITPSDDGLFGHGAEAEMATAPGADDTPSESTIYIYIYLYINLFIIYIHVQNSCNFIYTVIYNNIYVVHQQDRLLLSQLHLTFPSSMDGVKSRNSSKLPRPSELDNQTPPAITNRA